MVLSRKSCPVPLEQQPLEEYYSLIVSNFFSLPAKEIKSYFFFIFLVFTISIIFFKFFLFSNISFFDLNLLSLLNIVISSDLLLTLILVRLYFSWSYVSKRLLSAIVFYEESGWYDGQIWVKTTDVLIQDRLIAMNVSVPAIKRVKISIFIFVIKIFVEEVLIFSI